MASELRCQTAPRNSRVFQATYGDVKQLASVRGSTVTDTDGGKHNIKQLKIVPATSSAAIPAATSTAGPAKKKRLGAPILNALAQVLEGEEKISLTKASGLMRTQMTANGQDYNELLKATKASLIDLIRLADERFELVTRPEEALLPPPLPAPPAPLPAPPPLPPITVRGRARKRAESTETVRYASDPPAPKVPRARSESRAASVPTTMPKAKAKAKAKAAAAAAGT